MSGLAPVGIPSAAAAEAEPEFFGIRLLEVPVARRVDPRACTYIVDHLNPGATIQRRIEISNKSSVPRHIDLYAAAASVTNNGFEMPPGVWKQGFMLRVRA